MPYRTGPHPFGQNTTPPHADNQVGGAFGYGSTPWTDRNTALASTSQISARSPYTGSQMRQYAATKPAARNYGQGSGDRTRQAYGQAVATRQSNDYTQAMQDSGRQFQQAAEKARSQDIYAQRASQARRYGLDQQYIQDRRGIETQNAEEIANQRLRLDESKRDKRQAITNALISSLVGGGMLSSMGAARNAQTNGQGFFGGGGGGGGGGLAGMATNFGIGALAGSSGVSPLLMGLMV